MKDGPENEKIWPSRESNTEYAEGAVKSADWYTPFVDESTISDGTSDADNAAACIVGVEILGNTHKITVEFTTVAGTAMSRIRQAGCKLR